MNNKYKVGDIVYCYLYEGEYKIIATKENPLFDTVGGIRLPLAGFELALKRINEDLLSNVNHGDFRHVNYVHIDRYARKPLT